MFSTYQIKTGIHKVMYDICAPHVKIMELNKIPHQPTQASIKTMVHIIKSKGSNTEFMYSVMFT